VVALVDEDGSQLIRIEACDQLGRDTDAWLAEPIAERERPRIRDDVDATGQTQVSCQTRDAPWRRDAASHERSDQRERRQQLTEQRAEPERDAARREDEDDEGD